MLRLFWCLVSVVSYIPLSLVNVGRLVDVSDVVVATRLRAEDDGLPTVGESEHHWAFHFGYQGHSSIHGGITLLLRKNQVRRLYLPPRLRVAALRRRTRSLDLCVAGAYFPTKGSKGVKKQRHTNSIVTIREGTQEKNSLPGCGGLMADAPQIFNRSYGKDIQKWLDETAELNIPAKFDEEDAHQQARTLLLGKLCFDTEEQLDENGSPKKEASPWLLRLAADIERLEVTKNGRQLKEYIKGDLKKLFTDDGALELMENVSPRGRRAALQFCQVPEVQAWSDSEPEFGEEKTFECELASSLPSLGEGGPADGGNLRRDHDPPHQQDLQVGHGQGADQQRNFRHDFGAVGGEGQARMSAEDGVPAGGAEGLGHAQGRVRLETRKVVARSPAGPQSDAGGRSSRA